MSVVDIDLDVASASATRWDENTTRLATDVGSSSREGAVCETNVEEAENEKVVVSFFSREVEQTMA